LDRLVLLAGFYLLWKLQVYSYNREIILLFQIKTRCWEVELHLSFTWV